MASIDVVQTVTGQAQCSAKLVQPNFLFIVVTFVPLELVYNVVF